MLSPYRQVPISLGERRLRKPWLPLDGKQFLFVLLPEAEWQARKNSNLHIDALVHKKGDATAAYQDARKYRFLLSEFDPAFHPAVRHPQHGSFVWAVHNMTDNQDLSQATLTRLEELRTLLARLQSNGL